MFWIVLGGTILTAGDIIFKIWTQRSEPFFYVAGLLVYLAGLLFLVQSFKTENIAVASAIFVMVNIVTLSLVSWLYFEEPLSRLQVVGIGLAFAAIPFLELGK